LCRPSRPPPNSQEFESLVVQPSPFLQKTSELLHWQGRFPAFGIQFKIPLFKSLASRAFFSLAKLSIRLLARSFHLHPRYVVAHSRRVQSHLLPSSNHLPSTSALTTDVNVDYELLGPSFLSPMSPFLNVFEDECPPFRRIGLLHRISPPFLGSLRGGIGSGNAIPSPPRIFRHIWVFK